MDQTSFWNRAMDLNELSSPNRLGGCAHHLGIIFTKIGAEVGQEFLEAKMPVNDRTKQPFGILHGGASCVLAETVGSVAANLSIREGLQAVGQSLDAHHIRPVVAGWVRARATAKHLGRKSQVWGIDIFSEDHKLVCSATLTMAIIETGSGSVHPILPTPDTLENQ